MPTTPHMCCLCPSHHSWKGALPGPTQLVDRNVQLVSDAGAALFRGAGCTHPDEADAQSLAADLAKAASGDAPARRQPRECFPVVLFDGHHRAARALAEE